MVKYGETLMNPFKAPNIDHTSNSSPLNPCVCDEHEKYYAPVDNTQVAFDDYRNYLNPFLNNPQRHAVLFHGETGCGKTSLMNRCLKLLKDTNWKLNGDKLAPYLIDVRSENLVAKSAEEKVTAILDHIFLTLGEEPIANMHEKFGDQLGKKTGVVLKFLENQLKKYKKLLIILFPEISTVEDIKAYMNDFYRFNWVLYFESENLGIAQHCKRSYRNPGSSPVKCLEVRPLNDTDGDIFIQKRLSMLPNGNKKVDFEAKALEKYLASALNRGGASIREIEVVCEKAYGKALNVNKDTIIFEDIAQVAISILQI